MTGVAEFITESGELADGTLGFARFSPDRRYRWSLRRAWKTEDAAAPEMVWCMLNPSKAGAKVNDHTVRRCVWFARREGCTALTIVNLFALVSTDPKRLLVDEAPVGWANDQAIIDACTARDVTDPVPRIVVVAWGGWGAHPQLRTRTDEVWDLLNSHGIAYRAFGLTVHGEPLHPARLGNSSRLYPLKVGDRS
jgi:hypothetical protein